jgi:hypothetical protein
MNEEKKSLKHEETQTNEEESSTIPIPIPTTTTTATSISRIISKNECNNNNSDQSESGDITDDEYNISSEGMDDILATNMDLYMSPPQTSRTRRTKRNRKLKLIPKKLQHSKELLTTNYRKNSLLEHDNCSLLLNDLVTEDQLMDQQKSDIINRNETNLAMRDELDHFTTNKSGITKSSTVNNSPTHEREQLETQNIQNITTNDAETKSNDQQQQQQQKSSIQFNSQQSKSDTNISVDDRIDSYKKISTLLKLALTSHQTNNYYKVPPTTPSPSNNILTMHHIRLLSQQSNSNQTIHACSGGYSSSKQSPYPLSAQSLKFLSNFNNIPVDNSRKALAAEAVWKDMYDFFVHYNDRATSPEVIEQRLMVARAAIPATIDSILSINYSKITRAMNKDINENMKSPRDYSRLYEKTNYIDQLCYLYWLVLDVINRVGYIESLYPSLRLLKADQPSYADREFQGTMKTLLLWYKKMTDLMNKCDTLGKFLGNYY